MTLEQKPAKGTSLTEALTVDRHASSAKFLRRLYRESAPKPRSPAGRGTNVPRSAKVTSVRLKSRPKSKPTGRSRNTTRETLSRGRPSQTLTPRRARPKRASRETSLAAAQPFAYHGRCIRPSRERTSHVRPRTSAKSHPSDHAGRPHNIRPRPFRLGPRPDCPADRPDRPSQRRGRPEALLKPNFIFSSPA
ncbi:unnamed protein product [Microthlaspi erraticum]|uniref:Uncharacterized protein n=1 Tax=Microthlaspi erraticum TaxID=1685480 RepID=A0A6D2K7E7_9BRAS|nr:unnamed protein product [Microthlaspi erraticum]